LYLSTPQLTFTPGNWNVPQTVVVGAAALAAYDGLPTAIIRHTVASADAVYNSLLQPGEFIPVDVDIGWKVILTIVPPAATAPPLLRESGVAYATFTVNFKTLLTGTPITAPIRTGPLQLTATAPGLVDF